LPKLDKHQMNTLKITVACLVALLCAVASDSALAVPQGFFGIGPQTKVTESDAQYMSAGGIESIRLPVSWAAVQPTPTSGYGWGSLDESVAIGARAGMQILPFLVGTPHWLEAKESTLPVGDLTERLAWTAFVQAAVERYGPTGIFWQEHGPYSANPIPKHPIRIWQIWNEANFYYFTFPVAPDRYAQLIKLTAPVIRSVDPGAKVILAGLFGKPDQGGRHAMPAAKFLTGLYRVPGIEADFDGVALHPYAFNLTSLEDMVEGVHEVIRANHDGAALYITEMGWGSQNDSRVVAFEQGPAGQARELRQAYRYLVRSQVRLRLRGVYWFSWKDVPGACSFCDSVGLFHEGSGFRPKPAWTALVNITGGRPRP
jgi:hypothetical protein